MLPKIRTDDYGYYTIRYYDGEGNIIAPDLDATLSWEFYDSEDTLQFTATTSSDPAITQEEDANGIYFKVIDIPLTDWAIGIVTVKAYAKYDGYEMEPYPMLATAFEIIEAIEGYCTVEQVLAVMAVDPVDIGLSTEVARNAAIANWIVEMSSLIDDYCNQTWTAETVPYSIVNTCARMVANFIVGIVQRNKSPVVRVGDYTIQNANDDIFTEDITKILDRQRKGNTLNIALGSLNPDEYETDDE